MHPLTVGSIKAFLLVTVPVAILLFCLHASWKQFIFNIFLFRLLYRPTKRAISWIIDLNDDRRRRGVNLERAAILVALVALLFFLLGSFFMALYTGVKLSTADGDGFDKILKLVKTVVTDFWTCGMQCLSCDNLFPYGALLMTFYALGTTLKIVQTVVIGLWACGMHCLSFDVLYPYKSLWSLTKDSQLFWKFFIPFYGAFYVFDWLSYIYQDYSITFKDLGRGGSAPTFEGWALARARATFANIDVMTRPRVHPMADPYRGRLHVLPQRDGARPTILGVTPQRQVDQRASPDTQQKLLRLQQEVVDSIPDNTQDITVTRDGKTVTEANKDFIAIQASFLEPGLQAMRRRLTCPTTNDDAAGAVDYRATFNQRDEFGGEIFHPHRDGTSHVVLHPEDVHVVLESGYGERHPFATESWYWKLYFHWWLDIRRPVPTGLVILYAPKHQRDMDVIRQIVEAAVWNETGGRLFALTPDSFPLPTGEEEGETLTEALTEAFVQV